MTSRFGRCDQRMSPTTPLPTIAISLGDPAGVGPEVVCKAMATGKLRQAARWVIVGDAWLVEQEAHRYGWDFSECDVISAISQVKTGRIALLDAAQFSKSDHVVGKVSAACGAAAIQYVKTAAELCIDGSVDAMVTAPICKESVSLNHMPNFMGHTEYIAALCGDQEPRLMLFNKKISVVHVSTHVSLVEATKLSTNRIAETIRIGYEAMVRLGLPRPRIAVCGLNPHAGENGMFGTEETEFISPAITMAKEQGIACEGPLPADTLFYLATQDRYDLIVAMYHDQGHAPMKLLDFEHTVNVTLGLPIIRTSVDHGTAFDIAGKNQAQATNLLEAMQLATRLCQSATVFHSE